MEAFARAGVDPAWYAQRERGEDEAFPWDHIDTGVSKSFLLREYRRAREAKVTRDCRSFGCNACGWERRGCEWSAANA